MPSSSQLRYTLLTRWGTYYSRVDLYKTAILIILFSICLALWVHCALLFCILLFFIFPSDVVAPVVDEHY